MKLTKKEIEMFKNVINCKLIRFIGEMEEYEPGIFLREVAEENVDEYVELHDKKGIVDDIYLIFPTLNSLKLFFIGEPDEVEFNDILINCENEKEVIEFMNKVEEIERWEIK